MKQPICLHELLRARIHARIDEAEWRIQQANPETRKVKITPKQLTAQWSPQFEQWMRARLQMGAIRYGMLASKGKPLYDHINSIKKRADLFNQTGNIEHLVDIANLAMVEYVEGQHPNKHFAAADNTSEHCQPTDVTAYNKH